MSSVDHKAAMIDRMATFLRGQTKLEGMLNAVGTNYNDVQTSLDQLLSDFTIDTATGDQLDHVGAIVGESRDGLDDSTYRQFVKARIQLNTASGTMEDIITIVKRLTLPSTVSYTVHVREYFPAEVRVQVFADTGPTSITNPEKIGEFLQLAKAAGVRLTFIANTSPTDEQFLLTDTDQVSTGGLGLSDTDYSPAGGTLSGIY